MADSASIEQAFSSAPPAGDQRIVIRGVSWQAYSTLCESLDVPGLRMTYLEGALEIMSPSREHEDLKTRIARLVELFALERDVPLYGYGSTTFRAEAKERGAEPDECYVVGEPLREMPDIAIEVVLSSGGLNKLRVYRGLGVREVWFWIDGRLSVYVLGDHGYEPRSRSRLIPELDFDLIARFVDRADQPQALKEYRAALRASE